MGSKQELLDDAVLEKTWNEALASLKKSIGEDTDEDTDLEKAGGSDSKSAKAMRYSDAEDDEEAEEEEDEEEEDEEDMEMAEKSMEDFLSEDEQSEAAMDVSPFLRQLAKGFDEIVAPLQRKVDQLEKLVKSQSRALIANMELAKSQGDKVDRIAKEDRKVTSIRRFNKSRFEGGNSDVNVPGPVVLEKSLDWLKNGKIDVTESGMIESRVNKGTLGAHGDRLDAKVLGLLKAEAS